MKLLACLVLAGCLPPGAPYNGPQAYGQPPAQSQVAGSTCTQAIECFAGCNQSAECLQACMTSADEPARDQVNALLACNSAGGTCEAELEACRGSSVAEAVPAEPQPVATEAMLPGQPHTTANILPWMIGNWETNNFHFTFYPDGRVKRAGAVARYTVKDSRYACSTITNEIGTVRQDGDLLIMTFAAAEENHCGDKQAAPALTARYRITWYTYLTPEVNLKLIDIDCTRGPAYCNEPMRRR
ncbi:MAG: hypothetical protein ABI867_18310 [Kofleriaceae bacterium]